MFGNIVIGHIEAVCDDNGFYQPAVVLRQLLVSHQEDRQIKPL